MRSKTLVVMALLVAACVGAGYFVVSAEDAASAPVVASESADGTVLVASARIAAGSDDPAIVQLSDGTQPCPATGGCPGPDCSVDHFNCYNVDTGEHACGWDGIINHPPQFSCPGKTLTIHVRHCPCDAQPGHVCPNEALSLVCL